MQLQIGSYGNINAGFSDSACTLKLYCVKKDIDKVQLGDKS